MIGITILTLSQQCLCGHSKVIFSGYVHLMYGGYMFMNQGTVVVVDVVATENLQYDAQNTFLMVASRC